MKALLRLLARAGTWAKRKLVYDEMEDMRSFYEKFKQPYATAPVWKYDHLRMGERERFMQEELDEFKTARENNDLAEMADALIDLVYVTKGTALELGLPWENLWQDVQRANMAKVIGKTKRNISFDVAKPPGWEPPNTLQILMEADNGSSNR